MGRSALRHCGTGWSVQEQPANVWYLITVERASPAQKQVSVILKHHLLPPAEEDFLQRVMVQHLSLSIQAAVSASLFAVTENWTAMTSLTKISVEVSTDETTSVPPSCLFLELSEAHKGEQHIESSETLVV